MENASLGDKYEYSHYGEEVSDVPVDCADGSCVAAIGPLRVAPLLLYALVFLVGVPGNAMVAWASRQEAQRRAGAAWFLHLAAADLLCCVSLPILSVPIARGGQWPYGAVGCRALPAVTLLCMFTSALLLAALSAHLCLLALRPAWRAPDHRRACRVQAACGAAWASALLLTLPSAIYRRLHRERYPARLECVVDYGGSAAAENTVAAVRFLCGFLGPLGVVAGCHGALRCRAARGWPLGTAVVAGFFVCWAPYHVLALVLAAAAPRSQLLARALRAEPLAAGLALAHSCLNPLLFLYFGRAQLRRSLPAACGWALQGPESQDESAVSKKSTSHDVVSEMAV